VATFKKIIVKNEVCVSCPTCGCEIPVLNTEALPRQFSVLCANCRGRNLYESTQVHDRKQSAGTTPNSGRIQFGMKRALDHDPIAAQSMPPKSRLNELASWLLQ
jgi:hypothetical protein